MSSRQRSRLCLQAVLLVLVIFVRAFQGQLPQELSGRGVKYAERESIEELRDTTAAALEGLQAARHELVARVEALEETLEERGVRTARLEAIRAYSDVRI